VLARFFITRESLPCSDNFYKHRNLDQFVNLSQCHESTCLFVTCHTSCHTVTCLNVTQIGMPVSTDLSYKRREDEKPINGMSGEMADKQNGDGNELVTEGEKRVH
jgi:hypothetical protein